MSADLTSTRPYLLRAMHAWMTDNNQTPLMVVAVDTPEVRVPEEHVENGSIVLNISWSATRNLELDNDAVSFEARFGGQPQFVRVPVESVRGIYARESGQGMMFQD
jgi:stringent starvation protein B